MKRIFIAVDISEEARRAAAAYIDKLQDEFADLRVGWERAEKLHLTLRFIGSLEEDRIEALNEHLSQAVATAARPFDIAISGTGVFPSPRKARVLWLGVTGDNQALANLAAIAEDACQRVGLESEKRAFKPHLTVARLKEPERSRALAERHLSGTFPPIRFTVADLVLYESKLRPTGSVYSILARFPLVGAE